MSADDPAAQPEPLLLLDIHHSGYFGWGIWSGADAPERWTAETVGRLMRHPGYKMGINLGAQSYQQNPRLAERIREWLRMFPGRVFITAGDYAQLTACVRTGESNVRQLTVGLEAAEQALGVRPTIWTMSEPGNFAQLPQVLNDLGFTGALLRIHGPGQLGSLTTTCDAGCVRWIGPDGSEILAIPEYEDDRLEPRDACPWSMWMMTRYLNDHAAKGNFTLDDLWAWRQRMAAKGISPVVMSKDDDHNNQPGGNNLCMTAGHRLAADTEGDPRFRWVSAEELFAGLPEPEVAYRPSPDLFETRVRTFCDYGFQANADWVVDLAAEAKLRMADFAAVIAAEFGQPVGTEATLAQAWKLHLGAQNHDLALKGLSSVMCYLQHETARVADEAQNRALAPVLGAMETGEHGAVVAFNPLGHGRREYATVTLPAAAAEAMALADDEGNAVPWEVVGREAEQVTMGFVADVPPLGWRRYLLRRPTMPDGGPGAHARPVVSIDGLTVRTPEYAVTFGAQGGIVSLVPAGDTRSVVDSADAVPGVCIAGDIGGRPVRSGGSLEIEVGAVSAVARERGRLGPHHAYEIAYRMTPGVPSIMLSIRLTPEFCDPDRPGAAGDPERKIELSARLAEHLAPTTCIRKAPMLVWPYDAAMSPIFAALHWVDYEGRGGQTPVGLALFNRGAIGQRWDVERNEVNVILASGGIGDRTQHVALVPHAGDWRAAGIHEAGLGYGAPLVCVREPAHPGTLPGTYSVATVDPANVTVSSAFRAGGHSYVRVWEHAGESVDVRFIRDGRSVAAERVSLRLDPAEGGATLRPHQIATFRLGQGGDSLRPSGEGTSSATVGGHASDPQWRRQQMTRQATAPMIGAFLACAATAGAQAYFSSQFILPPQALHCHSSSIVECPNGDFLVAWYRGSGERKANDVRIEGSRLRRGSDRWEQPFVMADVPDFPDCNPVVFIDPAKQLWLFWPVVLDSQWSSAITRVRTSTDYMGPGAPVWKWQDDLFMQPNEHFADDIRAWADRTVAAVPAGDSLRARRVRAIEHRRANLNVPLLLRLGWMPRHYPFMDGPSRMLVPLYSNTWGCGLVAITEDGGQTWHASRPLVGLACSQPALVRANDGGIVAYLRDNSQIHRVHTSRSHDGGITWSIPVATELRNPGSSVELRRLQNGHWVVIYNDTEAERYRLAVQVSADEGATWSPPRYLEDSGDPARGAYHYASAIQTADGRIHVTYSWSGQGGQAIKYAVFDEEWILGR